MTTPTAYSTTIPQFSNLIFRDHHFILLQERVFSMASLIQRNNSAKLTQAQLVSQKLQAKTLNRVKFFDYEDLVLLSRMISKVIGEVHQEQDTKFCADVLIQIKDRLKNQDFINNDMKNIDIKQLLHLMSSLNKTFTQVLKTDSSEELVQSIKNVGEAMSQLTKKQMQKQLSGEHLINALNQLTQFNMDSKSIIKEIVNKLKGELMQLKPSLQIDFLRSITRLQLSSDPKFLKQLQSVILSNLPQVTNQEISVFLESALLLEQYREVDYGQAITKELERRQAELLTTKESQELLKLQIQDAIKIFRVLTQMGSKEQFQSFLVGKAFCNLIFKNKDKMTTNQVHDATYIIRTALSSQTPADVRTRLETAWSNMKGQVDTKISKFNPSRLLFMIAQESLLQDQYPLFKEQQLQFHTLACIIKGIDDLTHPSELHILSSIFPAVSPSEANSIAVKELSKLVVQIRKQKLIKKQSFNREVNNMLKLLYVMCCQEVKIGANQQPQIIRSKDYWDEVGMLMDSLEKIGVLKELGQSSPELIQGIDKFQRLIFENQKSLLHQPAEDKPLHQEVKSSSRKVTNFAEQLTAKGVQVEENKVFTINNCTVHVDLYLPTSKLAFNVQSKYKEQDPKFVINKSILDKHNMLLAGDPKFTKSSGIINRYLQAELSPIDVYSLRYYEGVTLKSVDPKSLKEESFINELIKR